LRPQTQEFYKQGTKLRLRPQPFQVLRLLVERAGDVVPREALCESLWSAETFVDFEHGLNTSIKELRGVLGDSAEIPRYIETLPRCGYRFIAPVKEVEAPRISAENGNKAREAGAVAPPTRRRAALVVILCSCVAIGLAAWLARQHSYAKSAVPSIRSIAVLPMQNLSGDAAQEYFADGMTRS
jgi:DNA-binding winged helix-turn-helix (wHTH) protein